MTKELTPEQAEQRAATNKRILKVVGGVLAAVLVLSALASAIGEDETASEVAATPTPTSAFLRPTPEQETVLIRGLESLDPRLVENRDRAVSRAVDTCDAALNGAEPARAAADRYDGGTISVDTALGQRIAQVIADSFCVPSG